MADKNKRIKFHLKHPQVQRLLSTADTRCVWDFNSALGDTIKEKYESLYIKLVELNNVMIRKGSSGYFWVVTTPEVASIFETATAGFFPSSVYDYDNGHVPMGVKGRIQYLGIINYKWKLYSDIEMGYDDTGTGYILMGANPYTLDENDDPVEQIVETNPINCGALSIANFVI